MNQVVNRSVTLDNRSGDVLYVWLDSQQRSVNVFDSAMLDGLESAVKHVEANPDKYRLIVFASRKPGCFFAGADVHAIAALSSTSTVLEVVQRGQRLMQRVADLPVPTLAAINGVCMGGGLEFALACRFRVATDSSSTRLGLPEIKLGLIPGWGGTQRLVRRIGLTHSLKMVLTGSAIDAATARQRGLVDEVLPLESWTDGLTSVIERILGGTLQNSTGQKNRLQALVDDTRLGRSLAIYFARRKAKKLAGHYPAAEKAINAMNLSWGPDPAEGFAAEQRAFSELIFSPTARSLLAIFLQQDRAKKITSWCISDQPSTDLNKLVVVGAGTMGASIGTLAAARGMRVLFKEVGSQAVQAGQARVSELLVELQRRERLSDEERTRIRARMEFTTEYECMDDCDLAIEAVLEIDSIKREVFRCLDQHLPDAAILTSNTSSLSVTQVASSTRAYRRPAVAGLHFFNPVAKMQLVEVVRTESTSEATVQALLAFVRKLGKTPIVTSDKPGFLVNRVLFPYLGEAVRMVSEGIPVQTIDRSMRDFGMPMGPLELLDQVGVDVAAHVAESLSEVLPDSTVPTLFLNQMAGKGWLGRKVNRGFYDYRGTAISKGKNRVNHSLSAVLNIRSNVPQESRAVFNDHLNWLQRRLVYALLNESVHCLDEAVVAQAWMVDLGMVLGTGYAPFRGGPLRTIDTLGTRTVLANMQALEKSFGERFRPADGLRRAANKAESFLSSLSDSLVKERSDEYSHTTLP
ncbi:MAG: enoyl-CoA hydratase/isomerase family protein [Planctomycetales bacterium]|nr:enoyl-CoA hydratase/isomerase family protein [Planctomycetales bacterium]